MKEHCAFVLLSGGLDSSVALYHARAQHPNVVGVSMDYGQRHVREISQARAICDHLGCAHVVLEMPKALLQGVMLTTSKIDIPNVRYDQIEGVSPTYVPFRNGLMLAMITAFAHRWVVQPGLDSQREATVHIGAHAEDAHNWAYPDCTPEFLGAMANAIYIGTYRQVRLVAPLQGMHKFEIVQLGVKYGVPFELTWSCYKGDDMHCGACPTCYARRDAFKIANVKDPTKYAV